MRRAVHVQHVLEEHEEYFVARVTVCVVCPQCKQPS